MIGKRSRMVALFIFGIQARNEIADDGVTLACGIFETFAIDDVYAAPAVLDEAAALQCARCECDAGAARAEHFSEKFLGQFEAIGFKPIADHQQPAGEAFFDFMKAVAGCELAENESLALYTLQDALGERGMREEELLQFSKRHAQGGAFTLNEGGGGGGGGSEKM